MKSGVTTYKTSHRRINSNNAMTDYKTMQDLMRYVIEKLVNANPEDLNQLVLRPFLNPKVLLMRTKQAPLDFDSDFHDMVYAS